MRISQYQYDELLRSYNAQFKTYSENVRYLMSFEYTHNQAKNAVYRFKKGARRAILRRPQFVWNIILDDFRGFEKSHMDCVDYLMNRHGATFSQANSAVYQYRKNRGMINPSSISSNYPLHWIAN